MKLALTSKLLGRTQWRYCVKVGLAAALGYLLTQGGYNDYAIYSAFTAALIVGANVAEDLTASGNRVKGTLVGMLAGMAVSALFGPSALSVGLSVALTAFIALALGWGVPVARIGVTLCIITLAVHSTNALEYDFLRLVNTLIGIVVGLAVSLLVWPVRARAEIERATRRVLDAAARVLDAAEAGQALRPLQSVLYDALGALVKAGREGSLERRLHLAEGEPDARGLRVLQLGLEILAVTLAAEGHGAAPGASVAALRQRLEALAISFSSQPPPASAVPPSSPPAHRNTPRPPDAEE